MVGLFKAVWGSVDLYSWGQKTFLQMASTQNLALTERCVPKVVASGAAFQATEARQLTVIDERPVLHEGIMRSST